MTAHGQRHERAVRDDSALDMGEFRSWVCRRTGCSAASAGTIGGRTTPTPVPSWCAHALAAGRCVSSVARVLGRVAWSRSLTLRWSIP